MSNARNSGNDGAAILVIDDDAIMRDLVADWLEAAGYRVRKAADCSCGVGELRREPPALVISDMFMPGSCGVEAIAELKREHPRLALIALSGYFGSGQGISAEAALSAGADRALAKPVRRAELLSAVADLVGPPER